MAIKYKVFCIKFVLISQSIFVSFINDDKLKKHIFIASADSDIFGGLHIRVQTKVKRQKRSKSIKVADLHCCSF